MGMTKEYLDRSREAVVIVLGKLGDWRTAGEVQRRGLSMELSGEIKVPKSPPRRGQGGWSVFDWTDRTKRALEFMVSKGQVEMMVEGNITYYRTVRREEK